MCGGFQVLASTTTCIICSHFFLAHLALSVKHAHTLVGVRTTQTLDTLVCLSCLLYFGKRSSQFVADVFGLEFFDFLDEVCLFQTAVTSLLPIAQNLLQISHLQLLQIHSLEVNLLVVCQLADLSVLFLQFLADLFSWHSPRQRLGHLAQDPSGSISSSSDKVAKSVFLRFEVLAKLLELRFNFGRAGFVRFFQAVGEPLNDLDANLALAFFKGRGKATDYS